MFSRTFCACPRRSRYQSDARFVAFSILFKRIACCLRKCLPRLWFDQSEEQADNSNHHLSRRLSECLSASGNAHRPKITGLISRFRLCTEIVFLLTNSSYSIRFRETFKKCVPHGPINSPQKLTHGPLDRLRSENCCVPY